MKKVSSHILTAFASVEQFRSLNNFKYNKDTLYKDKMKCSSDDVSAVRLQLFQ